MVKITDKSNYSRFARPANEPARVVCIDSPALPKPES